MKKLINKLETKLGVDIDGDGTIGGRPMNQGAHSSNHHHSGGQNYNQYPPQQQFQPPQQYQGGQNYNQYPPQQQFQPPQQYQGPQNPQKPYGGGGASWNCPACTFLNSAGRPTCEMCNTPNSKAAYGGGGGGGGNYYQPPYVAPAPWPAFQPAPYVPAPLGVTPVAMGTPVAPTGRKKALLIGINYIGSRNQLRGCINDVRRMTQLLQHYQFPMDSSSMVVLTDDSKDRSYQPTARNILSAMQWLTAGVQPGDILFFHYSGHGGQQRDPTGMEEDGLDETILPVDFKTSGQITDNTIFDLLVRPLPSGVRLTAVMDCCHSGTGMDLPYTWTKRGWVCEENPCHSQGDVQLFSGCEDHQTSADVVGGGGAGGAMTTAFIETLQANVRHTYPSLMEAIHANLRRHGYRQRPQLTSSQQFNLNKEFSLSDIVPNTNPQIGRLHKKNKKKKLIAAGVGIAAGLLLADILF